MGPLIQTPLPLLAARIGLSDVLFLLLGIIAAVQVRIDFEVRGRPLYKIGQGVQHPAAAVQRPGGGSSRPLHRLECSHARFRATGLGPKPCSRR